MCTYNKYLVDEYKAIEKGEQSNELECHYTTYEEEEDGLENTLQKLKVQAGTIEELRMVASIVRALSKPNEEFYVLSIEQLDTLVRALCIYDHNVEGSLHTLFGDPDSDGLIGRWVSELSHKSVLETFRGHIENQIDIYLFIQEIKQSVQLRRYIMDAMQKSESTEASLANDDDEFDWNTLV